MSDTDGAVAWIDTIAPDAADPDLARLYDRVTDPASGQLDHIMRIHSLHPAGLAAHFDMYRAVMRGSPELGRAEREMIGVVVSAINGCVY